MERTVMQELIDWIEEQIDKRVIPTSHQIQIKAQDLLPKEREQIVEAHMDGDLLIQYPDEVRYDAEQYYSSKYGDK